MLEDMNFGLTQKFDVKCSVDITVFVILLGAFISVLIRHDISPYEGVIYIALMSFVYITAHVITKNWVNRAIRKTLVKQSDTVSNATHEAIEILKSQKTTFENLVDNTKKISAITEKLRDITMQSIDTSKSTEKQVTQSITFSQRSHDAIAANAEKMLVLRQKVQMIAELILELSEHTQQIGNSIGVVDDIAEQTNMLALNAAVEAARAGEHGKGFAVVAGEIRKLADESKQAITKITSLTSNIQYTTNSTVMATDEGSKEIESVVKDIDSVSATSENLMTQISGILESLIIINQFAEKQNELLETLNNMKNENMQISSELSNLVLSSVEKLNVLSNLSDEIKNSVTEG